MGLVVGMILCAGVHVTPTSPCAVMPDGKIVLLLEAEHSVCRKILEGEEVEIPPDISESLVIKGVADLPARESRQEYGKDAAS